MRESGYTQVDHTADLALSIWAPDYCALLNEAARALVDIMTEGANLTMETGKAVEGASDARSVAVEGLDREDLLVQWMNEIIFQAVTENFLVAETKLKLEGLNLSAVLCGVAGADHLKGELKSATYHGLELIEEGGAVRAFVVIDV